MEVREAELTLGSTELELEYEYAATLLAHGLFRPRTTFGPLNAVRLNSTTL